MPRVQRPRRKYEITEKVAILRRHLVDKVPVSTLCNELDLPPSVFYQWLQQAMDNLGAALTKSTPTGPSQQEKALASKVTQLEAKLVKKDSVIAEISAEYVQLKKEVGEP